MLKITPNRENGNYFKLRLCGQLTKEYVPEVERLLAGEAASKTISIDLANVTFVDREAMVFLCSVKARNIAIENCPSYVIRWIARRTLQRFGPRLFKRSFEEIILPGVAAA